jgi:hypothetical protein
MRRDSSRESGKFGPRFANQRLADLRWSDVQKIDVWSCVADDSERFSYRRLTAFINRKYLEKLKAKKEPGKQ